MVDPHTFAVQVAPHLRRQQSSLSVAASAVWRRCDRHPRGMEEGKQPGGCTVKWFNANKGCGYIKPEIGNDVFVHISVIQGDGSLEEGQAVQFDIVQAGRFPGRQRATNRRPVTPSPDCIRLGLQERLIWWFPAMSPLS
jgi:cold shock protein